VPVRETFPATVRFEDTVAFPETVRFEDTVAFPETTSSPPTSTFAVVAIPVAALLNSMV
jgi:hypothetical protein